MRGVCVVGYYECSCSCSLWASLWRHIRLHDGNQNTSSKTLTIITILGKSDQDSSSTLTSLVGSISVSLGTPWGTRRKRWLGALGVDATRVLGADIKSLPAGPAGRKTVSEPGLPPGQEEPQKSWVGGAEVGGDSSLSSWRSSRVDWGRG